MLLVATLAGCGRERPAAVGAALSASFLDAARLAVEDAAGAPASPDTVLVAEANSRAAAALEVAERFRLTPGMVAVVAHSNSASSLATAPVYNLAGIVQLAPTSTAPRYSEAGPFSFRLVPPDDEQGLVLAHALDSLFPSGARVALLYVNDDYGRGIRRALLSRLDSVRFPVVHDQPHVDDELRLPVAERREMVASLTGSLAASAPGVVFWLGRAHTFGLHLGVIRDSLGAIPILGSDGLSTWASHASNPAHWEGVRYTDFIDPAGTAARREFTRHFRERYGSEAGTGEILSYDAMRLILAAIADGAHTGEAVRAWLHDLGRGRPPFEGLSGPIAFDASGDVRRPHVLLTISTVAP